MKNKKTFLLLLLVPIIIFFIRKSFALPYTEEVKSVEIQSEDYDEPGSWHIDKSAEWTEFGKARVKFDVNSVLKTEEGRYKDIILVIDVSGSMEGEKLERAKSDAIELTNYLLSDTHNSIALITFDTTSEIITDFINNKEIMLGYLNGLIDQNSTNYNSALKNVDIIMENYVQKDNTDLVTLFLTDGYPNEETPNEVATYHLLKDKYPYMTINGIQYEMGKDIIQEIINITDNQWVADVDTLHNVLFDASVIPLTYDNYVITDYINDEYFYINSVDDIIVDRGTIQLEEENGKQRIIWNLGDQFKTGSNGQMAINLLLKDEYHYTKGLYPTNSSESVRFKLIDSEEKIVNSELTPILKNVYHVTYDPNTPHGCNIATIPIEEHYVFENVTIRDDILSCDGYLLKGWKINDIDKEDIKIINDNTFIMPSHDVTIKALWSKQNITKLTEGTVREQVELYSVLENAAIDGTYAKKYTGEHQDSINNSGIKDIYYWYASNTTTAKDILNKNNVLFANHCWQMYRTTDTGGVKLIYNGEPENDQCLANRSEHVGYSGSSSFQYNTNNEEYWYGTDYTYDSSTKRFKLAGNLQKSIWNEVNGPSLVGKFTCKEFDATATCERLFLIESYHNETNAYEMRIISNAKYYQYGIVAFSNKGNSPAYQGYMFNTVYPYKSVASNTFGTLDVLTRKKSPYERYTSITNDSLYPYTYDSSLNVWKSENTENWYTATLTFKVNKRAKYAINLDFDLSSINGKITVYKNNQSVRIISGLADLGELSTSDVVKIEHYKYYNVSPEEDIIFYLSEQDEIEDNRYLFGKSFIYANGTYKLVDAIGIEHGTSSFYTDLNGHHYTCFNSSGECQTIGYIYNTWGGGSTTTPYYIELKNGKSVEDAINEMFYNNNVNLYNSTAKTAIDLWYERYLINYSNYLEDTIFCNNRNIYSKNGWNPNGGVVDYTRLYFQEYISNTNLKCSNITDSFSTTNNKAKLKYPVGLPTTPEMRLLGNNALRATGNSYLVMSPYYHSANLGWFARINADGGFGSSNIDGGAGIRPVISLKPGIKYDEGNGSMEHPYIIDSD